MSISTSEICETDTDIRYRRNRRFCIETSSASPLMKISSPPKFPSVTQLFTLCTPTLVCSLSNHLDFEIIHFKTTWKRLELIVFEWKSHQSVFPFILWSPPSTTTCLTKSFGKNENLSVILKMSWFILYEWKFAISSYFSRSQRSGLKAPLWVTVFSTMKILTTRSDTSLNITSRVSTWKRQNRKVRNSTTSKEKRSIKAIFLGFGRTVPEKAGSLQLGTEGRGGREQLLEGATSQTSYLSFF